MQKNLIAFILFPMCLVFNLANAEDQPTSWRFQKDQDSKCIARSLSNPGLELMPQKLTIATKETSDLKSYAVSINEQTVIPMGRVNLTDTACKCIRIRNTGALTSNNLNIRIQGQTTTDKPIDVTLNVKDAVAALEALKSESCKKS